LCSNLIGNISEDLKTWQDMLLKKVVATEEEKEVIKTNGYTPVDEKPQTNGKVCSIFTYFFFNTDTIEYPP